MLGARIWPSAKLGQAQRRGVAVNARIRLNTYLGRRLPVQDFERFMADQYGDDELLPEQLHEWVL